MPEDEICTLRIELCDSTPLIWRQVEIPTSVTFKVLHDIVQAAMGWHDQHLWEFQNGPTRISASRGADWGGEPRVSATKLQLREVLRPRRTTLTYLYDFGDSWEHRLVLTKIRQGEPGVGYPRYLAGENNAPPEDCGGIPGFYTMLEIIADPAHPDHASMVEWLGEYDPQAIDASVLKMALGRLAKRRNAALARRARATQG